MTNLPFQLVVVPVRGEKCRVCGCSINLDRIRMDCKKGTDCPYYGRAADRLAEAIIEWNHRHSWKPEASDE